MIYLQWVLSITSGIMLWLMGNKSKYGPWIGIANQALWIIYATITRQYGLLPGVILYTIIHIRNAYRWDKQP